SCLPPRLPLQNPESQPVPIQKGSLAHALPARDTWHISSMPRGVPRGLVMHLGSSRMSRKSKKVHTIESLSKESQDIYNQLMRESDRGAALIAGAYLETILATTLRRFLVHDENEVDQLFGENRPLGSFSSCIRMAYCLGLIGPGIRRDLDIIRGIRNEFA